MAKCAKCGIPHTTDVCPRWATATLKPQARVCIRIGDRWPDCRDHVFVYFADCKDDTWILTLDLTTGEQSEVPIWTAGQISGDLNRHWTRRPTVDEESRALAELTYIGHGKYRAIRRLV